MEDVPVLPSPSTFTAVPTPFEPITSIQPLTQAPPEVQQQEIMVKEKELGGERRERMASRSCVGSCPFRSSPPRYRRCYPQGQGHASATVPTYNDNGNSHDDSVRPVLAARKKQQPSTTQNRPSAPSQKHLTDAQPAVPWPSGTLSKSGHNARPRRSLWATDRKRRAEDPSLVVISTFSISL